jgi:hypothetical protein
LAKGVGGIGSETHNPKVLQDLIRSAEIKLKGEIENNQSPCPVSFADPFRIRQGGRKKQNI